MSTPARAKPWPVDLAFDRAARKLKIGFDTGETYSIPFELLRVQSPSAEVRGHRAGEAKLVAGKADVNVREAQPVGRYAVRIIFDDGHDTGLFSWDYLHELGRDAERKMADYTRALESAGLKRR